MTQDSPIPRVFKDELAGRPNAAYRVLVTVANPATSDVLLELALAVARRKKGEVTILHVVSPPAQASPEEVERSAGLRRMLLETVVSNRRDRTVPVHTITRVEHRPCLGIIATAREEHCSLIILGWQGHMRRLTFGVSLGQVLDPVIANAPCDVAVVKVKGLGHPRRLLVPTAGGPNAILALDLALALGWRYKAEVTLVNVGRTGEEEQGRRHIAKTLAGVKTRQRVKQDVITAEDAAKGILKEARDYDMILLGATHETAFQQVLFGTVPELVAKRCPKTLIMVKGYRGPLVTLVRRTQVRWRGAWERLRLRLGRNNGG